MRKLLKSIKSTINNKANETTKKKLRKETSPSNKIQQFHEFTRADKEKNPICLPSIVKIVDGNHVKIVLFCSVVRKG